jgi:hypothetical protein
MVLLWTMATALANSSSDSNGSQEFGFGGCGWSAALLMVSKARSTNRICVIRAKVERT